MRSKAERLDLTEKKVAKRLRQLLDADKALRKVDGLPWVRRNWLKDRSIVGRCGHRRCICHLCSKHTYREKKYEQRVAEIVAEVLARPPRVNEVLLEAFRENRDLLEWSPA